MNWSNKWPSELNASGGFKKPDSWDEKKGYIKEDTTCIHGIPLHQDCFKCEHDKALQDAAMFGTGIIKDGKHIAADKWSENFKHTHTTITFQDGHKVRRINVIIIGDLALDFDDDGWNIYHVPTLACFSSAVPDNGLRHPLETPNEVNYLYERDALLNWMKKVQEQYPTSWQMLRLLTPETYADKGQTAKDIIKKWCLSVKVE